MPTANGDALLRRIDGLDEKLDRLSASFDERFGEVDQRFAQIDVRFAQVDERFAQSDRRFDQVDRHFAELREHIDFGLDGLRKEVHGGFQRLERKLDQFIDVQLRVNQDHDARLRAVERSRSRRKR